MKSLLVMLSITLLFALAQAQIKTAGIKTHYPGYGNLRAERNESIDESQKYNGTYSGTYVPAETYQGGSSHQSGSSYQAGSSYQSGSSYQDGSSYQAGLSHLGSSTYQGGNLIYDDIIHDSQGFNRPASMRPPTRAPVVWDATAEFINKTRSAMASGVCYKEVPTSSLLIDNPSVKHVGNGTSPNMSRIQICCDGYDRNPHVFARCDPVCKDDCPNGICTAPNTCVCMPGHVRNDENKCITTCPIGCGNGRCDERGDCQCKPGYTLEPLQRKYCIPQCEHGCQFGKCVAPNKCDCYDGYRLTAAGACEAKCDNCENGQCTAPGFCSCNKGYLKVAGICEPVCELGCHKGECVAPDTCSCPRGFDLDRSGTKCEPHCDQPCLNGVCNGDNSCVCNAGYIQDEHQRNICQPHCPQGCPNGYCTRPNFCVCRPGFIKSGIKGRQQCMPV